MTAAAVKGWPGWRKITSWMSGRARSVACRPSSMHSCGAVELEEPDRRQLRRDHHVGRIAREARAGDAVLRDVEGVDHDGRDAGRIARRLRRPARRRRAPGTSPSGGVSPVAAATARRASSRRHATGSPCRAARISPLRLTQMTMSAPSARAAVIGIGLTRAPSISQRPPNLTGSKMPGRA